AASWASRSVLTRMARTSCGWCWSSTALHHRRGDATEAQQRGDLSTRQYSASSTRCQQDHVRLISLLVARLSLPGARLSPTRVGRSRAKSPSRSPFAPFLDQYAD